MPRSGWNSCAKITASMDVLHAIDSFFATRREVSRQEFAAFVASALRRQPEVGALGWTPRVSAAQRDRFEQAARKDGLVNFQFVEFDGHGRIVRAKDKSEYFPVYYLEPVELNHRAIGFELGSSVLRRQALEQAQDTGQAIATAPMRLVQGRDDRLGFVVYLALMDPAAPAGVVRRDTVRGYASAVFWMDDLLGRCLADLGARV